MRIFFDTRDLVGFLDRREPCAVEELNPVLRKRRAVVALSSAVVFELAAPLVRGSGQTVVSRRLNQLEELPLVYLADGRIRPMEVKEAISALEAGRAYKQVDPTAPRLDAALDITGGKMGTLLFLNFPLAEIVLTIWQEAPDVFTKRADLEDRLRRMLVSDRELVDPPSLVEHFRTKLRKDLRLFGIAEPACGVARLADWVYEDPTRCPGTRLSYEVYHQIRRNTRDRGFVQDFADFSHLDCLPYVDVATLDGRMADYVGRVTRAIGGDHLARVKPSAQSVLEALEAAA